jgi:putative acetyltransferase
MITLKRTNSGDENFRELVKELDRDLKIRDGEEHSFFAQFNKIDTINHVVVAYDGNEAVGCGAFKEYSDNTMEIKRMFVPLQKRGQGIASLVLQELEKWCGELKVKKCILETGEKQPEALKLYKKNNYRIIPNFGQYAGVESSVCFEKEINR